MQEPKAKDQPVPLLRAFCENMGIEQASTPLLTWWLFARESG